MKPLTLVGLALSLLGALVLALRDLLGRSTGTRIVPDREMKPGVPETDVSLRWETPPRQPESWIGFALIALGTALQFVAVAVS